MEASVETILREMESEDLFRLADGLEEIQENPAWPVLLRLIEAHRNKIVSQMIARPSPEAVVPAHAGGVIKGMEAFLELIEKVADTRQKVSAALVRGTG